VIRILLRDAHQSIAVQMIVIHTTDREIRCHRVRKSENVYVMEIFLTETLKVRQSFQICEVCLKIR